MKRKKYLIISIISVFILFVLILCCIRNVKYKFTNELENETVSVSISSNKTIFSVYNVKLKAEVEIITDNPEYDITELLVLAHGDDWGLWVLSYDESTNSIRKILDENGNIHLKTSFVLTIPWETIRCDKDKIVAIKLYANEIGKENSGYNLLISDKINIQAGKSFVCIKKQ